MEFLHRYQETGDKEIAGFFASQFAYGKIEVMKRFLRDLFERMGDSPERFIREGNWKALGGLYYRFQKSDEIILLFEVMRYIYNKYGCLGDLYKVYYKGDTRKAIWSLRNHLPTGSDTPTFFFPKPFPGSPLKRWHLFLRWMVRKDEIDAGLWEFMDPQDLVVPLDTHLFKIGRCCGWTERRSPSWNAAQDITDTLKRACPEDPLKYDALLCHRVGIGAGCTGNKRPECAEKCILMR